MDPKEKQGLEIAAATPQDEVSNHGEIPMPDAATTNTDGKPLNPFADQKLHWTESVPGKLAIRTFSRGILGAAFFAWGARYSGQQMENYNPGDPTLKNNGYDSSKPLQVIAKILDKAIGTPIQFIGDVATGNGKDLTTFRPTRSWGMKTDALGAASRNNGRTLGAELVGVTFDFAMASIGNGIGDEMALGIFNPKARAKWLKDGKFEFPHAVKTLCQRAWHILSYRAGEDVAVALPYVYYLRAQRNLLNKIDPNFGFDSDRATNGGSIKVDDFGQAAGKDYQATGMIDLWGRFTAYNVMTLMYREIYRKVADGWKEWKANGFGLPDKEDLAPSKLFRQGVQAVKDISVWAARSTVKALIVMIPSVPFFFATRSPQSKFMGMAIHPKKGPVGFWKEGKDGHPGEWNFNFANQSYRNFQGGPGGKDQRLFDPSSPTYFVSDVTVGPSVANPRVPGNASPFKTVSPNRYDAYAQGQGWWQNTTDAIGGTIFDAGSYLQEAGGGALPNAINRFGQTSVGKAMGLNDPGAGRDIVRKSVHAAASYTPYFMMKTDIMGNLMDNQQMNVSIDRAIKGVTHGNWNEFKAGVGDTWRTITRKPLMDEASLSELGRRTEGKKQDSSPTNHEYAKSFVEKTGGTPQEKHAQKDGWRNIAKSEGYMAKAQAQKLAKEHAVPPGTRLN